MRSVPSPIRQAVLLPVTSAGRTSNNAGWPVTPSVAQQRTGRRSQPAVTIPALRHGVAHANCREAAKLRHEGAAKFLDELLIWRELAYVFCFFRSDHDQLSALPEVAVAHWRTTSPTRDRNCLAGKHWPVDAPAMHSGTQRKSRC